MFAIQDSIILTELCLILPEGFERDHMYCDPPEKWKDVTNSSMMKNMVKNFPAWQGVKVMSVGGTQYGDEVCHECHALLAAAGVKVEVVTAKTNRNRQLDDFAAGKLEALINMAILTEGFDCPQLKTVFCRPSGKSCTIQMAGRVFRRHEQHPIKQVVQCKATPHPMLKTALADEQYVWTEQSWRSLSINKNIEAITNRMRKQVAHAEVQLPRIVSAHRAKGLPWQRMDSQ